MAETKDLIDNPDQVDMLDLLNLKRDAFGQPYEYKPVTKHMERDADEKSP